MANLCKVESEFKDKCAAINNLPNNIDTTDKLEIVTYIYYLVCTQFFILF